MEYPYKNHDIAAYNALMAVSFQRWTGFSMMQHAGLTEPSPDRLAQALYDAPFSLVSHGTEADPIFRYANRTALALWEMDWDAFTRLPSRLSAEPNGSIQDERQKLLKAAMEKGWVDHYSGIRVSKTGKRFEIQDTILWNVTDTQGIRHGQAALILRWRNL